MRTKFQLGDTLYHRLKPSTPGMVTQIMLRPGATLYSVIWSNDLGEKWHYEMELTEEQSFSNAEP